MQPAKRNLTRSRNGCAVCKSKRLKCDEARPQCSRCKRLGIQCPGYEKRLRWMADPGATDDAGTRPPPPPQSQSQCPATSLTSSPFVLDESVDQVYSDIQTPNLFQQFTNIIDTPGSLDISEAVGAASQVSEFLTEPWLELPNSSLTVAQPVDQAEEQAKVQIWLDTILKGTEDEYGVLQQGRRMSQPPTIQQFSLPPSLQDYSSILVEYYFKEVCGMMSCYDSSKNPYRTTISAAWSNSPALYYILQSMAAACLAEVSPGLAAVGRQLRDKAICLLSRDAADPSKLQTSSLIALVMLGFSMSWHDPSSLGQEEFDLLSKALVMLESQASSLSLTDEHRKIFFYNSLVYGKMLLSFVSDGELRLLTRRSLMPAPVQPEPHVPPHPQTGIGIEVQELVAHVGSLVRSERKRIRSRQGASRTDIEQAENAIRHAEQLHVQLCVVELPTEDSILDPGDDLTPTSHLVRVAEAYRITGLLQLYRNFPDLLLSDDHGLVLHSPGSDDTNAADSETVANTWLTILAIHVLDLIHDIPITSRSRSIQPLLLVSICSELSLNRTYCSVAHVRCPVASVATSPRFVSIPSAMDILHARRSLLARLSSFENVLAAKPIRQMLTLVKDTWLSMDRHQQEMYWMDVMMEKGYETLMG